MAITKYESYYSKILSQLVSIRNENDYSTDSMAFIHWYLSRYYKSSEQEIAESILDGSGDLGIDAVLLDEGNQSLTVMQFRLPSKVESIGEEIDQGSILKTWNGFKTLVSNEIPYTGDNVRFKEIKEQLKNMFITKFRIIFISYNKGVIANRDIIDNNAEAFRRDTGSELEVICQNKDAICNIYEGLNRKNNIKIKLKYKQMQSAYNVRARNIDSHVGFVNGVDLVNAISDQISTVFDENIRLYEFGSSVNNGINRTATSTDQADMFYFYNNGVVFICDKATNSPASSEIELEGASVVNGCQTLNVLYNASQKNKLSRDVCLLVRVIVIADYSERMKITEYLNSQTPIRDSYFVANHSIIRDLQRDLFSKGYFLERQINEYKFMAMHGETINEENVLQLEKVIQYYVGYWINKDASVAKRGKNALFDKNKIEELLSNINADKVIESVSVYNEISEVLTLYRKTRRKKEKADFANYMNILPQIVLDHLDEFRYLNTGDIIILNAFANLKLKYAKMNLNNMDHKEVIRDAIMIVREIMMQEGEGNTSLLTKNASVFNKIQSKIESLSSKYSYTLD